jgi:hypothetical protein
MATMTQPKAAHEARKALSGREIWLWHYMHSDWQWEQSRQWHEERYALAVKEALDIMRDDPEFRYFIDTTSEFYGAVARHMGPRMPELQQRIAEGRVRLVSGQVANCRPTQVGDETYIRNIQLGREFFLNLAGPRLADEDLTLFHSVDIAIGGSQMPQILKQLGFKYYRAWRPHGPMNVLGIPHQFVWEGMDGSRLLVTRGSYGGWLGNAPLNDNATDWDNVVDWVYGTFFHDQVILDRSCSGQLWMIQGADDARPLRNWLADRPDDMQRFVKLWRERESVPIHWATPLEFSQAVAERQDLLPVVKGVLDGVDCGYNMANHGSNGLWMWRQMNDRRLLQAELWAVAASSAGYEAPQEQLRELWYQHCTYQAHAQDHGFLADFDFLVDRARNVKYQAERIQEHAQAAIVRAAGGGERTTRYILNPLPWQVEADVVIYHPAAVAGVESLQVVDENGKPFAQQQLREFRHPRFGGSVNDEDRLVRLTVPPMGYRRVEIVESPEPPASGPRVLAEPADGVVQTASLRLVYRDHALREILDLATARRYSARDGGPWPTMFYHALDHQDWACMGPEVDRFRFEPLSGQWLQTGPLRWHHRSIGRLGPYQASLDTFATDRGREIQVSVRLEGHWHEPPVTGFATLMAGVEAGGSLTADVPFGVEPRDPDCEPYYDDVVPGRADIGIDDMIERLRPGVFWGRSWVDWSGRGQGMTIISVDGCYYWFKEPGQLGHVMVRGVELKPGTWEAFCPPSLTGSGVHQFCYAFRFHDGEWRQTDPQRRSLELRHAPLVVRADHPSEATLPVSGHSFLTLEGPALLSACYAEEAATVVRFYEHTGSGGEVNLALDRAPATVQAVDLLGRPVAVPVQANGDRVTVNVRPWQIVTLKLGRA